MTRTGRILFFTALFVAALVMLLPMRVAMAVSGAADSGLSARTVSGSAWRGQLRDARFGTFDLGDLAAALQPLPLLTGSTHIAVRGAAGQGLVIAGGGTRGIDALNARVVAGPAFAPMPLDALSFEDARIIFRGGKCAEASGRVRASFSGDVAGLALAQGLSGTLRCDRGVLVMTMLSQSAMERLTLSITGTGSYRAEFFVRAGDPALMNQLATSGFGTAPGGLALRMAGHF